MYTRRTKRQVKTKLKAFRFHKCQFWVQNKVLYCLLPHTTCQRQKRKRFYELESGTCQATQKTAHFGEFQFTCARRNPAALVSIKSDIFRASTYSPKTLAQKKNALLSRSDIGILLVTIFTFSSLKYLLASAYPLL